LQNTVFICWLCCSKHLATRLMQKKNRFAVYPRDGKFDQTTTNSKCNTDLAAFCSAL
jgi:hypothetical protein